MSVNGTHGFEREKNIHRQNQMKPWRDTGLKTRNDHLCKKLSSIYIPLIHPNIHGGSQTYKCITTTYLSNGLLTHYLQSQLGVSMLHLRNRIRGKKRYKYCSVSCTDDRFVSLDLCLFRVSFGFVCVCFFFLSQSRESHWRTLYDWQTATVLQKSSFVFYWRNKVTSILEALGVR